MQILIELIIGVILAIGFILLARRSVNFTKEKRILAVGLVVAALIYVGFGVFSDSVAWKIIELLGVLVYALFAWLGLKKSGWFLAVGWALHVVWDAGLHGASTPFVPHWYIAGCIGFDLLVAGYIGVREIKKIK
ncbi:MAG TPA: DUF6010 family protein [Pyrinomonadaceae bacterium]|nr:DUF6010 family protein [Pyrinomonadaceae bacterium]